MIPRLFGSFNKVRERISSVNSPEAENVAKATYQTAEYKALEEELERIKQSGGRSTTTRIAEVLHRQGELARVVRLT